MEFRAYDRLFFNNRDFVVTSAIRCCWHNRLYRLCRVALPPARYRRSCADAGIPSLRQRVRRNRCGFASAISVLSFHARSSPLNAGVRRALFFKRLQRQDKGAGKSDVAMLNGFATVTAPRCCWHSFVVIWNWWSITSVELTDATAPDQS